MTETLHEMAERMVGQYCRLTCETCPVYPLLEERGFCLIHWIARYENADEQINALLRWAGHPTVVQCKDCRYWQQEVDSATHWVCMQHSCGERIMHTTPDFYCADGKRAKEDEKDD